MFLPNSNVPFTHNGNAIKIKYCYFLVFLVPSLVGFSLALVRKESYGFGYCYQSCNYILA